MTFEIEIIEQHWLEGCLPEQDLCSHGRIRLVIGGQVILSDDQNFSVSESALALSRTLDTDNSPGDPVAERLIFHGCGTILMLGCPIGVDWTVRHVPGFVVIDDITRYETTDPSEALAFRGSPVAVPDEEYSQQIIAFATKAKQLFEGVEKTFYSDFDREQYERFWREFDSLLARHGSTG